MKSLVGRGGRGRVEVRIEISCFVETEAEMALIRCHIKIDVMQKKM